MMTIFALFFKCHFRPFLLVLLILMLDRVKIKKQHVKVLIRCEQCGTMKAFPISNVKKIKNKDS